MKQTLPIVLIALLVALSACSGSKRYFKKGQTLDESGLRIEAANFYIEALRRKPTNDKAIIALKTTGQRVYDERLAAFYQSYADERYRDAVYAYIDAQRFINQVVAVGVTLSTPSYYAAYFEESRNIYIAELYDKAQQHLQNEAFEQAENLLEEIKNLDPTYKDVNALSDFAFVEPKYRQALHEYDIEHYRQAYLIFDEINNRTSGYKESVEYAALALENAQFPISILPIENRTAHRGLEAGISGTIIRDIQTLNDPFIKLIDRTHTDALLAEQYYNMSGAIDQSTAQQTGTLLGSKALLVGRVVNARLEEGRLIKNSRTGWLGKEIRYVDDQGVKKTKVVYDKVYYYEYEQTNRVTITFQYQLISTQTGEVLANDLMEISRTDDMNYATFNGDTRYLFAGYWRNLYKRDPSDRRYETSGQKRQLDQLLRAPRTINNTAELSNQIFNQIGSRVANALRGFNPEK